MREETVQFYFLCYFQTSRKYYESRKGDKKIANKITTACANGLCLISSLGLEWRSCYLDVSLWENEPTEFWKFCNCKKLVRWSGSWQANLTMIKCEAKLSQFHLISLEAIKKKRFLFSFSFLCFLPCSPMISQINQCCISWSLFAGPK